MVPDRQRLSRTPSRSVPSVVQTDRGEPDPAGAPLPPHAQCMRDRPRTARRRRRSAASRPPRCTRRARARRRAGPRRTRRRGCRAARTSASRARPGTARSAGRRPRPPRRSARARRAAGWPASVPADGWRCSTSTATSAPAARRRPRSCRVRRASSASSSSSGLKRRSTENHAAPGTTLKFAPLPDAPPTTSIEPRASPAARARQQLASRQRLGDAHHVLERVHAEVRLPDVRRAAAHLDPQRDRAAARVPDDAAGRLGRQHRDRGRVDQPGVAQVPGAGDAAGLLVADEVERRSRPSPSRPSSRAAAAP